MQTLNQAFGLGQVAEKMFFSPCLLVIESFNKPNNPGSADELF